MRAILSVVIASAIVTTPALAQETNNVAGPDENIAAESANETVVNEFATSPEATEPIAAPPVFEDEDFADATVTPERSGGGGLPWGLLGLLGLVGLLGRNR